MKVISRSVALAGGSQAAHPGDWTGLCPAGSGVSGGALVPDADGKSNGFAVTGIGSQAGLFVCFARSEDRDSFVSRSFTVRSFRGSMQNLASPNIRVLHGLLCLLELVLGELITTDFGPRGKSDPKSRRRSINHRSLLELEALGSISATQ